MVNQLLNQPWPPLQVYSHSFHLEKHQSPLVPVHLLFLQFLRPKHSWLSLYIYYYLLASDPISHGVIHKTIFREDISSPLAPSLVLYSAYVDYLTAYSISVVTPLVIDLTWLSYLNLNFLNQWRLLYCKNTMDVHANFHLDFGAFSFGSGNNIIDFICTWRQTVQIAWLILQ